MKNMQKVDSHETQLSPSPPARTPYHSQSGLTGICVLFVTVHDFGKNAGCLLSKAKKQNLYINDGTYGSLFDAGVPNIVYPSKIITNGRIISKKLTSFDFYGPTCDSMDYMKGPFLLPNNVKENDYIELGQLGAYGLTFRTEFNGFYSNEIYEVEDSPIMSLYNQETKNQFLVA